jgi:hypothetical protein
MRSPLSLQHLLDDELRPPPRSHPSADQTGLSTVEMLMVLALELLTLTRPQATAIMAGPRKRRITFLHSI